MSTLSQHLAVWEAQGPSSGDGCWLGASSSECTQDIILEIKIKAVMKVPGEGWEQIHSLHLPRWCEQERRPLPPYPVPLSPRKEATQPPAPHHRPTRKPQQSLGRCRDTPKSNQESQRTLTSLAILTSSSNPRSCHPPQPGRHSRNRPSRWETAGSHFLAALQHFLCTLSSCSQARAQPLQLRVRPPPHCPRPGSALSAAQAPDTGACFQLLKAWTVPRPTQN